MGFWLRKYPRQFPTRGGNISTSSTLLHLTWAWGSDCGSIRDSFPPGEGIAPPAPLYHTSPEHGVLTAEVSETVSHKGREYLHQLHSTTPHLSMGFWLRKYPRQFPTRGGNSSTSSTLPHLTWAWGSDCGSIQDSFPPGEGTTPQAPLSHSSAACPLSSLVPVREVYTIKILAK